MNDRCGTCTIYDHACQHACLKCGKKSNPFANVVVTQVCRPCQREPSFTKSEAYFNRDHVGIQVRNWDNLLKNLYTHTLRASIRGIQYLVTNMDIGSKCDRCSFFHVMAFAKSIKKNSIAEQTLHQTFTSDDGIHVLFAIGDDHIVVDTYENE